jgi:GDPmannose 4,6-dehydratase
MLQQDEPDDYVIATGEQHSVREFCELTFREAGMLIEWKGKGLSEKGILKSIKDSAALSEEQRRRMPKPGDVLVAIDSRYFRPTEVDALLGDSSKARMKLNWKPKIGFKEMISEMVKKDILDAKRDALCNDSGYPTYHYYE